MRLPEARRGHVPRRGPRGPDHRTRSVGGGGGRFDVGPGSRGPIGADVFAVSAQPAALVAWRHRPDITIAGLAPRCSTWFPDRRARRRACAGAGPDDHPTGHAGHPRSAHLRGGLRHPIPQRDQGLHGATGQRVSHTNRVTIVTMRELLPRRLYPGRDRVGANLTEIRLEPGVSGSTGSDWYWLPSLVRAAAFLRRRQPAVMVLQWWTGTVLHSYLALCLVARALGARVVIEFHEVQDTGRGAHPTARGYVARAPGTARGWRSPTAMQCTPPSTGPPRTSLGSGKRQPGRGPAPRATRPLPGHRRDRSAAPDAGSRPRACNLLFFGIIRPYKGLEDLVAAFELLTPEEMRGLLAHGRGRDVGRLDAARES